MPNAQALQIFYGTIPVIVVILLAIWINNKRVDELSNRIGDLSKRSDSLENSLGKRIDDLRNFMISEIGGLRAHMDSQVTSLREFIRSEVRRLEERIERIEHPIVRR